MNDISLKSDEFVRFSVSDVYDWAQGEFEEDDAIKFKGSFT